MAEDARATVKALVELAAGPTTPEHEAMAAALAACRRIKALGLLDGAEGSSGSSARDARRRGRGARGEAWGGVCEACGASMEDEDQVVVVRIPFLVLTESDKLYRVAKLEPPKRASSHILLIPKEHVRGVTFMVSAESRAIGWKDSKIIKEIRLVRSYFEKARQEGWDDWR